MNELLFDEWVKSLPLHAGSCGYFNDRQSLNKAFIASRDVSLLEQDIFMNQGFRRSGEMFYRSDCPHCKKCQSIRLDLQTFQLQPWMKKVLRKNKDLRVEFIEPKPDAVKELLYLRYQYTRHKEMKEEFHAASLIAAMKNQMYTNPNTTLEMNGYFQNQLCLFATLDVGVESVSAVYSVFDPDMAKRSLGSFFILRSLLWAQENHKRYYHLGYYIDDYPKMKYKERFTPFELRKSGGTWG